MDFGKVEFDVQVNREGRWQVDTAHTSEDAARKRAEALLKSDRAASAVRVVRETKWREEILFEKSADRSSAKPIRVRSVEEAPVCQRPEDYLAFPARRVMGRLLREYLDREGLTALEVLHQRGTLKLLLRNDTLYNQALSSVATLQAKTTGEKPGERSLAIERVIAEVAGFGDDEGEINGIHALLERDGIEAARSGIPPDHAPLYASYLLGAGLARAIGRSADWNGKIERALDLAAKSPEPPAWRTADEIVAEILDGTAAVREFLGYQPDLGSALATLAAVATGRAEARRGEPPVKGRLNTLLREGRLPLTREILLERVVRGLGGITPLSSEGIGGEVRAFASIFNAVVEPTGLAGSSGMAAAITRRMRSLHRAPEGDDLPPGKAIDKVMMSLRTWAGRFGYLLDLHGSDFGKRYPEAVQGAILVILPGIQTADELLAAGSSSEDALEAARTLRTRIDGAGLPDDFARKVREKLAAITMASLSPTDRGEAARKPLDRRALPAGTLIFDQGALADDCYILHSGAVDVFVRDKAGNEAVINRLGPGELLGEMAMVDDQPRSAGARTVEASVLLVIPRADFATQLDELSPVMRRILVKMIGLARILSETLAAEIT